MFDCLPEQSKCNVVALQGYTLCAFFVVLYLELLKLRTVPQTFLAQTHLYPIPLGDRREISGCVFRFSEVNLAVRIGQIMLSFDLKNPSQFRNAHASAV